MSERDALFERDDGAFGDDDEAALLTDDGDGVPDEVRAELAAVALAEAEAPYADAALEQALTDAQRELEAQRAATRSAVARYREALLAAEPELPPDLVAGDTLEALDASVASARETVARVRERLASTAGTPSSVTPRGFPVGAPARGHGRERGSGLSSAEKIAAGLSERR